MPGPVGLPEARVGDGAGPRGRSPPSSSRPPHLFTSSGKHKNLGSAKIVEGETKVSKLGTLAMDVSKKELKAYDLRGMFIAMTEDVRIIIIKLADRLHNADARLHEALEEQKLILA